MSLAMLQRAFGQDLVRDLDPGEGPGFRVYHNAYRAQLADCLAETFEQARAWLGDAAFMDAARDHIEHTPPSGWTLGVYGDGFDRTLARLYPDDPEVAELAWLEWALGRAFEGRDAVALAADKLADTDWDRAILNFVPTLCLGHARTNAGAIWSSLSSGDAPPPAIVLPEPGAMLVWRQEFMPCFRSIEMIEHGALAMMSGGATFAAMCGTLVETQGETAGVATAGAMLGQWLADGLINDITEE
ncbi:hypothetical protein ACVWZA_002011 [Sphingomonas sp. UYAg733]